MNAKQLADGRLNGESSSYIVEFHFVRDQTEYTRRETLNFIPHVGLIVVGFNTELHVTSVVFLLEEKVWSVDCRLNAVTQTCDLKDDWEPQ